MLNAQKWDWYLCSHVIPGKKANNNISQPVSYKFLKIAVFVSGLKTRCTIVTQDFMSSNICFNLQLRTDKLWFVVCNCKTVKEAVSTFSQTNSPVLFSELRYLVVFPGRSCCSVVSKDKLKQVSAVLCSQGDELQTVQSVWRNLIAYCIFKTKYNKRYTLTS